MDRSDSEVYADLIEMSNLNGILGYILPENGKVIIIVKCFQGLLGECLQSYLSYYEQESYQMMASALISNFSCSLQQFATGESMAHVFTMRSVQVPLSLRLQRGIDFFSVDKPSTVKYSGRLAGSFVFDTSEELVDMVLDGRIVKHERFDAFEYLLLHQHSMECGKVATLERQQSSFDVFKLEI